MELVGFVYLGLTIVVEGSPQNERFLINQEIDATYTASLCRLGIRLYQVLDGLGILLKIIGERSEDMCIVGTITELCLLQQLLGYHHRGNIDPSIELQRTVQPGDRSCLLLCGGFEATLLYRCRKAKLIA